MDSNIFFGFYHFNAHGHIWTFKSIGKSQSIKRIYSVDDLLHYLCCIKHINLYGVYDHF